MKIRAPAPLTSFLVVLGWSTSFAALTLGTLFHGQLLPRNINGGGLYPSVLNGDPVVLFTFYAGAFAVSVLAAVYLGDLGKSVISFFSSYVGCAVITYLVLILPDLAGVYDPFGAIEGSAVTFTFVAMFPAMLLLGLTGTMVGVAIGGYLS